MTQEIRHISLDTETTGLDPLNGDRVVEIGCVELINDLPTGRKLHLYINPERDVPQEAVKVHGLTNEFLDDKPLFADIAEEFLDFIGDSKLIIHNAKFDIGFLDAELDKAGHDKIGMERAIDTINLAKRQFPGAQFSLDALCRRFDVSLEARELHGALLDAELLGEVWLGLNGGRQPEMNLGSSDKQDGVGRVMSFNARQRPSPLPARLSDAEKRAHAELIKEIDEASRKASKGEFGALWARIESEPAEEYSI